MLMSTISRLLSAWFAFLLPCYATFKALSRRPVLEPELQKWAMYWTVIGAFVAFEYLAEWLISWLPFYWEIKTALLLFLSLPQTQGSNYVYTAYLEPFFSRNEHDLDAGIVALHSNVLSFIQGKLAALWEMFWAVSTKTRPQANGQSEPSTQNPSPLGWFLSTDAVRSAINSFQPAGSQSHSSIPASSRHNSNVGTTSARASPVVTPGLYDNNTAPPPFPVPQHFRESQQS